MPWLPVYLSRSTGVPPLDSAGLHVWWWPADAPDPAPSRRARVDRRLRVLLAPYLGLPPESLQFGREGKGRPFLWHPGAPDFNFSDTAGGSVLAVCAHGRVGIDIERCDRQSPVAPLAARWFAADEAHALRAMAARDDDVARRAFLRLWTAKEAACKATGTGIFGRLSAWRFALDDDGRITALSMPPEAGAAARWRFLRLSPAPTHTVALACKDVGAEPLCLRVVSDA